MLELHVIKGLCEPWPQEHGLIHCQGVFGSVIIISTHSGKSAQHKSYAAVARPQVCVLVGRTLPFRVTSMVLLFTAIIEARYEHVRGIQLALNSAGEPCVPVIVIQFPGRGSHALLELPLHLLPHLSAPNLRSPSLFMGAMEPCVNYCRQWQTACHQHQHQDSCSHAAGAVNTSFGMVSVTSCIWLQRNCFRRL